MYFLSEKCKNIFYYYLTVTYLLSIYLTGDYQQLYLFFAHIIRNMYSFYILYFILYHIHKVKFKWTISSFLCIDNKVYKPNTADKLCLFLLMHNGFFLIIYFKNKFLIANVKCRKAFLNTLYSGDITKENIGYFVKIHALFPPFTPFSTQFLYCTIGCPKKTNF